MSTSAKAVLKDALRLPASDRAALVEGLISSLDHGRCQHTFRLNTSFKLIFSS